MFLTSIRVWLKRSAGLLLLALALGGCQRSHQPVFEDVATIDTAGWAHDVIVRRDRAYVADRQGGFLIFQRAEGWTKPAVFKPVTDVISLAPYGERTLLAARFEGLVLVSPDGGVLARYSSGDIANTVAIRNDIAYISYGLHGLVVTRIEPTNLRLLAELPSPGWSHDVKLRGNHALLADWNYGLRIVDIRNPDKPVEVGALSTPSTAIAVALGNPDQQLVAVAEGHAGVSLVSLENSGRPTLIARNTLGLNPADAPHPEAGGWAHGVAWVGKYLFVANWKKGLTVLDTSNVGNPRIVMEHPTSGTALAVAAEPQPDGSILVLVADGEAGLQVLIFRS